MSSDIVERLGLYRGPYLSQTLLANITDARDEIVRLREALTPSSDTKAAYMGEFSFPLAVTTEVDGEPVEETVKVIVPWPTIKDIMKAILSRAALAPVEKEGGDAV